MNNKLKKNNNIMICVYILFLLLWFVSSEIFMLRLISIMFFAIFSILRVIKILKRGKIYINKPIILYLLFSIWCLSSSIWSIDRDAVVNRAFDLFCNTIFLIISYDFFYDIKISQKKFLSIFITIGCLFSAYILFDYGINNYFSLILSGNRVGGNIINVNFIGVICSITFLLIIFMYINSINKNKIFLITSLLPLIISLGTGSKKALICIIIGLLLIFLYYIKGELNYKKIITAFIIIFVTILSFSLIKSSSYFNEVFLRMDQMVTSITGSGVDGSTELRKIFIMKGFETLIKYPITGIGLNNSYLITKTVSGVLTYLHCNYVELLACTGIIGFLLYYLIYYYCIRKYAQIKQKSTPISLVMILILLLLFIDIGSVTYYEIKTSMYFIIIFVLLDKNNWIEVDKNEYEK